jgi:hypothetical protein
VGESCERTVDEPFCQVVSPLASLFELGQSLFEEAALGVGVDEFECAFVGCAGVVGAVEPAQEFGAGRVQVVVVLEFEPLGERECGLDVSCFGERGCLVGDRRARELVRTDERSPQWLKANLRRWARGSPRDSRPRNGPR